MRIEKLFGGEGTSPKDIFNKRVEERAQEDTDADLDETTDDDVDESEAVIEDHDDVDDALPDEDTQDEDDVTEDEDDSEDDNADDTLDDEDDFFVDIDGEEISFSEIKALKAGNLRQSDYTKKTQAIADDRKAIDARENAVKAREADSTDIANTLQALVDEFEETVDMEELKEYDPAEYITQKKKQDDRKAAIAKSKQAGEQSKQASAMEENQKMFAQMPQWMDKGETTPVFKSDMAKIDGYLKEKGVTPEEAGQITSHKTWLMILDAAKGTASSKAASSKKDVLKKKLKKAPIVTKSRSAGKGITKTSDKKKIEAAEIRAKKTGSLKDIAALRKLKRSAKG